MLTSDSAAVPRAGARGRDGEQDEAVDRRGRGVADEPLSAAVYDRRPRLPGTWRWPGRRRRPGAGRRAGRGGGRGQPGDRRSRWPCSRAATYAWCCRSRTRRPGPDQRRLACACWPAGRRPGRAATSPTGSRSTTVTADGEVVTMELRARRGQLVLSDLTSGPGAVRDLLRRHAGRGLSGLAAAGAGRRRGSVDLVVRRGGSSDSLAAMIRFVVSSTSPRRSESSSVTSNWSCNALPLATIVQPAR